MFFDRQYYYDAARASRRLANVFDQLSSMVTHPDNDAIEVSVPDIVDNPENLNVEVSNGMLCVSAKKTGEGSCSQFCYRTSLPKNVDQEKIECQWDKERRVLRFNLPHKPEPAPSIEAPKICEKDESSSSSSSSSSSGTNTQECKVVVSDSDKKTNFFSMLIPRIEVNTNKNEGQREITIHFPVSIKRENIDIDILDRDLRIQVEGKDEHKDFHFARAFSLPKHTKPEEIKAHFDEASKTLKIGFPLFKKSTPVKISLS